MKIIFVDDEINAIYNFLNGILEKPEFEYKFFKGDAEAVRAYVAHNDVVAAFLDINMPEINGFELAENLIGIKPEIKMIFITGLSVDRNDLNERIGKNTVGFLYKPYTQEQFEQILSAVKETKPVLTVKMFDSFDCFIDGRPVPFSSLKSKELFALLLAYNGKTLTMGDAICHLWPDYECEKSKVLYRDAVWRLRKALKEINFNCVIFQRAQLVLSKENIVCDYWDYLNGLNHGYFGEFLKNYDWSINYLYELDHLAQIRKK